MSTIYSVYSEHNLFDQSTNWVVTYHTFTYSGPWQEVGWLVSFCLSFPGNSSNDPILKRLAQPLSHTENQESCHFHGLNPGYCLGKQAHNPLVILVSILSVLSSYILYQPCHLEPLCLMPLHALLPMLADWFVIYFIHLLYSLYDKQHSGNFSPSGGNSKVTEYVKYTLLVGCIQTGINTPHCIRSHP